MATTTRNELKQYFQKGRIPTQAQFEALIDSGLNQLDDRLRSSPNDPLTLLPSGTAGGLLGFSRLETNAGVENLKPTWLIRHEPSATATPSLLFQDAQGKSALCLQGGTGYVGIGTTAPDRPLTLQPPTGSVEWLSLKSDAGETRWHVNHLSNGFNLAETVMVLGLVGRPFSGLGGPMEMSDPMETSKRPRVFDGRFFIASGGNVGIGTTTPKARLQVAGGAIMPAAGDGDAGIQWPPDPFDGSGDRAWIRYHNNRGGEKTTLEIGVANDGDDHIVLNPSGNVGIGVAAPEVKLDVNGDIRIGSGNKIFAPGRLHISGDELLYLLPKNGVVIGKEWGGTGDLTVQGNINAAGSAIYFTKTDFNHSGIGNVVGHAAIENSTNLNCLMILGRQQPGSGGRIVKLWDHVTVHGTFTNLSDLREKQDITDLSYGLAEVRRLRPVSYNWRSIANPHKNIGLIAQEVKEVIRDVVYAHESGGEGNLSISYVSLIPVLINAVKELAIQIEQLSGQSLA